MAFDRKASNSSPSGEAEPSPKSEIKGDYDKVSPTKRFRDEKMQAYGLEHHLDKGKQPHEAQEGRAKDPTPNNA